MMEEGKPKHGGKEANHGVVQIGNNHQAWSSIELHCWFKPLKGFSSSLSRQAVKTKGLLNLHKPKNHKSENFATTTTFHKDSESLMEGRNRISRP
jgi:hypothetical protein